MKKKSKKRRKNKEEKKKHPWLWPVVIIILLVSCFSNNGDSGDDESSDESSRSTTTTIVTTTTVTDEEGDDFFSWFDETEVVETEAVKTEAPAPKPTQKPNPEPAPAPDPEPSPAPKPSPKPATGSSNLSEVPSYNGDAYVAVNGNVPYFSESDLVMVSYEEYSPLDSLGRCGVAVACIGQDLMPTEERGSIGQVKPTGWHTVKYDFVDGKYLYNRCHLIGFQLTGENANERNLITGTRFMNTEGMLPFENMVADYIKETGNHVLYRVTPDFKGNNLLASGVLMEAESVEDHGAGILFNVYCYNIQAGVTIDYATGDNQADDGGLNAQPETPQAPEAQAPENPNSGSQQMTYILNTSSKTFHLPGCSRAAKMKEANKQEYTGSRDDLIASGYQPCGTCHP